MIWYIYEDYRLGHLKTNKYIKLLKWYNWIIFLLGLGITFTSLFFFIKTDDIYILFLTVIFAIMTGIYFGYEHRKIILKKEGSFEEIYGKNLEVLRVILKERSLWETEKIQKLINQIESELPQLKTSNQIFAPINSFVVLVVLPLVFLILNKLLESSIENLASAFLITIILLMIFAIYYAVKPLLDELLNYHYIKFDKFKRKLEDIILIDF